MGGCGSSAGSGDGVETEQGDRCRPPNRLDRVLDRDQQALDRRRIPDLAEDIGSTHADAHIRVLEGDGEEGECGRSESNKGRDCSRTNEAIVVGETVDKGRSRPYISDLTQGNTGLPPDIGVIVGGENDEVVERTGPEFHEGLCSSPADALLVRPLEGRDEGRQRNRIPELAEGGSGQMPHSRLSPCEQADKPGRIAPPAQVRHPAFWDK